MEPTGSTEALTFQALPDTFGRAPDAAELDVLEGWRAEDVFTSVQAARASAKPFVFWEGPPTANGRPGIHHVLARTIKDSICRFQTMRGRRVMRKAGWDTHGLPVELEVEKSLGISGKPEIERFGVAEFNARCRESVWKYRKEWEELSERIGYWLDYESPYVTYDESYVESLWYLLARFHREGLVYRGKRVLPFCPRCGTGLSSHELGQPGVYRDVKDPSVTLRFRLKDAPDESFLAWTTTPWTLPSNFALAVHPGLDYVRARVALPVPKGEEKGSRGHEIVWLAAARAKAVLGENHEVLDTKKGAELVGTAYLPLFDVDLPPIDPGAWVPRRGAEHHVFSADFVSADDGTGIVHQAPYGADDWDVARTHELPVDQAVGSDGKLLVDVGGVSAGTFFKEADDGLMDDLKARGLLFKKAREDHSYPHCWRCDTALFYFPAPAWYIRVTAYKERMIELNRRIRWVPEDVGTGRFGKWLEGLIDWNLSRDRYWGTPLPFWVCEGCDTEVAIESREELERRAGSLPEGFDNHKPLIDEVTFPCECGGTLRRTPSVADCWFDSGAMPYAQYHWPFGDSRATVEDQYPADFIAEGVDQTRGWFYTLHAIGCFVTGLPDAKLPDGPTYKTCLVNGLVLDKDGVKMSKRLGNIVNPKDAIGEHGVDAVRWYLLSSGSVWLPKRFDMEGVGEVRRRFLGTLINSYRFFAEYARLDGFDPRAGDVPAVAARPEIDRWLVSRTQTVLESVRSRMDDYDLAGATRALERFVVDELSNWYIRRNRRRFWKGELGADKSSAYASLFEALRTASLLLAPFCPFLAEALFRRLDPGAGSVHAALLPDPLQGAVDRDLERAMELVERVVGMGRALRERAGIRVRQPLRSISVRSSDARGLELLAQPFATEQVLDELNVKGWGSLEADDGELCRLTAKPNFRSLGKRLGKRMKAGAAAIAGLAADQISAVREGGTVEVEIEGEKVALGPDDLDVRVEVTADFDVETDGRTVVFLDAELDEELIVEGIARELVIRINALRKESGLAVEERVRLRLSSSSPEVTAALDGHGEFVAEETLCVALERLGEPFTGGAQATWDLGEERVVEASLVRA